MSRPTISEKSRGTATRRDCGAVSLYAICRLHGRSDVTPDYLRTLTETDEFDGTTMLHLKDSAEFLGFSVAALKLNNKQLRDEIQTGGSAILHLPIDPSGHFVAVVSSDNKNQFGVFDPALGAVRLTNEDLRNGWQWKGAALILRSERVESMKEQL
jgi:ABC-type bacteriocin/lantibiotic exporter with double-glycine peptidase domain